MARTTMDIDLVTSFSETMVQNFIADVQSNYYFNEASIDEAIRNNRSFNLIHLATAIKIDIFILKKRPYDQQTMPRKVKNKLASSIDVYFCSPEDILLNKLEWYKNGDCASEKQWSDILGVLRSQKKKLDSNYLNKWAKDLNLEELLTKAITDAN